jgi:hypothetical protein
MVYVVDIVRRGDEHRSTNLPTIQALNDSNLISRIWISIDSTSYLNLKGPRNFISNLIHVRNDWMYRWLSSTLLTLSILCKSARTSTDILFLSATPLQSLLISVTSLFTKKRCKYFVFLHGELSYLAEQNGLGRKIGGLFLRIVLRRTVPFNVYHVVLAFPVYIQVLKLYKNSNLRSLEIPTEGLSRKLVGVKASKLRIGSFGVHCADKNSGLIYELARRLARLKDKIEIVTIGVAHIDFQYDQHPQVSHLCRGRTNGELISHDLFVQQVKTLDLALIFYSNSEKYKFISSGVVNDCINYGIPVAGLYSEYLEFYQRRHGDIGLIRESLDELAEGICSLAENPALIERYKENIIKINRELCYSEFKQNVYSIINDNKC